MLLKDIDLKDIDLKDSIDTLSAYNGNLKKICNHLEQSELNVLFNALKKLFNDFKKTYDENFIDKYKLQNNLPPSNGTGGNSVTIDDRYPILLTKKEAADYLRVSIATIDRMIKNKIIPSIKLIGIVRISIDDLDPSRFMQAFMNNEWALCITNFIYFDLVNEGFILFNLHTTYRIVDENKTWVYLYNEDWNHIARIGQKLFKKNFRLEGSDEWFAHVEVNL